MKALLLCGRLNTWRWPGQPKFYRFFHIARWVEEVSDHKIFLLKDIKINSTSKKQKVCFFFLNNIPVQLMGHKVRTTHDMSTVYLSKWRNLTVKHEISFITKFSEDKSQFPHAWMEPQRMNLFWQLCLNDPKRLSVPHPTSLHAPQPHP